MKIIIIDTIYDTEDIFSISEIFSYPNGRDFTQHKFFITFYNKPQKAIEINGESSIEYKSFYDELSRNLDKVKKGQYEPFGIDESLLQKSASIEYGKIKKLHSGIVSVWSKNQSTLPKFDFT